MSTDHLNELKQTLRPVKAHELARHLHLLTRDCDYHGCNKTDILDHLSKHYDRMSAKTRQGSLTAWAEEVVGKVQQERIEREAAKARETERKDSLLAERDRMIDIATLWLCEGKRVSADDQKFFTARVKACIHRFYRTVP